MKTAALGLWESLFHSASLRSIVIVLKAVAAKTNLRETNTSFNFTSLLSNQKYELEILLV